MVDATGTASFASVCSVPERRCRHPRRPTGPERGGDAGGFGVWLPDRGAADCISSGDSVTGGGH